MEWGGLGRCSRVDRGVLQECVKHAKHTFSLPAIRHDMHETAVGIDIIGFSTIIPVFRVPILKGNECPTVAKTRSVPMYVGLATPSP